MIEQFEFGYLLFHILLTVPIILILSYLQTDLGVIRNRRRWINFALLVVIAYVYTIPWDNFMISLNIWWYGDIVWGKIWHAPVGEYLFFGIQTIIAGLYLYYVGFDPKPKESDLGLFNRVTGFFLLIISAIGCLIIAFRGPIDLRYATSILAWTLPVIAIQWLVGGNYIIRKWKLIVTVTVPTTVYLWFIDGYAIATGLWTINPETSMGISVGALPVEEMLFFLSANIMTIFGMILFEWVLEVWKQGNGVFVQNGNDEVCRMYYLFEDKN